MNESTKRILVGIAAVGAILTLFGLIIDTGRVRTAGGLLLAASWVLGIGLGGLAFVALGYITRAGWSAAIRRVPEAMAGTLPLGAAFMLVALALGPFIYQWMDHDHHDALLEKKAAWLNSGFFYVRAVIYLGIWLFFARAIRRVSVRQDETGDVAATGVNLRLSTIFMICFALTFSFACFDWIMSIEAHWFSTVFAIYCFSGMFLAAIAAITLISILLKRQGTFAGVLREDHLHDLGKLMLGFATFWAYIWFCQYMLIWYSNMPEETSYFITRFSGAWGPLMFANLAVNWLVPFLVLLPRPAKRNEGVMFWVAILLLVGRAFDLFLLIQPGLYESPHFGVWEIAPLAATVPIAVIVLMRAFGRANPVPRQDPMLGESLHYHN